MARFEARLGFSAILFMVSAAATSVAAQPPSAPLGAPPAGADPSAASPDKEHDVADGGPAPTPVAAVPAQDEPDAGPSTAAGSAAAADDQRDPCDANWFARVYAATHKSVVRIETGGGLGAGFAFHSPRHIATAYHVVSLGRPIEVTLADGQVTTAQVVATDPENDIAILELEGFKNALRPLPAAAADRVELGSPVIVIGHPFALGTGDREEGLLNWSVSQGIISARGTHQLQTDAAINPGNSGGPLIDCQGRVLGVVSAKLFADNIGFVIPITRVEALVGDIGRVPPVMDAWQFSLGAAMAIQATPDDALVGFGIQLSAIAYDSWMATVRVGNLWSSGEDELGPNVVGQSLSRMMIDVDLQHRWLVMTRPFPWYVGLTVGGAAGRTTQSARTVNARLLPDGCSGSACTVQLDFTDDEQDQWMGWPSAGVATNLLGNLDLSYAFLPDVTDLESSPHRILMGLSF